MELYIVVSTSQKASTTLRWDPEDFQTVRVHGDSQTIMVIPEHFQTVSVHGDSQTMGVHGGFRGHAVPKRRNWSTSVDVPSISLPSSPLVAPSQVPPLPISTMTIAEITTHIAPSLGYSVVQPTRTLEPMRG